MAKDPAVLLYTSDFLTGTITMSYEEKGKYITLLCIQHQKGLLTEKDMFNICNSHDTDVINKFTKTDDGFYYNERMKFEADKRKAYSASRSSNRTKKEKNIISKTHDKHMENENENVIENTNINVEKYIEKFNKNAPVKITKLTDARKKMISIIVSNYNDAEFDTVMKKIKSHPFLNGSNEGSDWKVTFDWLFKEDNFIKVLEGYENNDGNKPKLKYA